MSPRRRLWFLVTDCVSDFPVHHELVNMRWVSLSEFLRLRWRSCVIMMQKAIATGIAMITKVQLIHAVLCIVKYRASGIKYIGIGAARDRMAMSETVSGKPRVDGHQLRE